MNTSEASSSYPRLHLTFGDDAAGRPVLVDAEFILDASSGPNRELAASPTRGKYVQAACIALLLAKYRGESFITTHGGEQCVSFRDDKDRPSWIRSLANALAKYSQRNILEGYFSRCAFFSQTRGTQTKQAGKKGALPAVRFLTGILPLQNLFFSKSNAAGTKRTAMTESDLASFARRLEEQDSEWNKIVPEMIIRTDADRPPKSPAKHSDPDGRPYRLSARWRELLDVALKEAKERMRGGDWYVICVTPSYFLGWKDVFRDAIVKHGARIKFAFHSELAGTNCPSIQAQWRMHVAQIKPKSQDGVDYLRDRLKGLKVEMSSWKKEATANAGKGASGGFEFYESRITHPYMAIMSVPQTTRPTVGAPVGTWCFVQLYLLYSAGVEERCGLYLNRPSLMLDNYYHSITSFFENGGHDGHLRPAKMP